MNQILNYDSSNTYSTMSIASIGPSTLYDAKMKPKIAFISKPSEVFTATGNSNNIITSTNKHSINDISDIDGAQPKKYRERNYQSKGLQIDDIEGTKARVHDKFLRTNRHVNPLNPSYQLPSVEIAPYEPSKFLRDGLEIDDIQGTRSKTKLVSSNRDILQIDDIEGARSGWKPRHMRVRSEAPPHEVNITVTKSKYDRFTDHTQRVINPLQPSYYINGTTYEEIENNKPSKPRHEIVDNKLLRTDDIEGAQAGYSLSHRLSIPEERRREYRNINYLDDINGAHADTIKHSIRTTREINPLVPIYQSLDGNNEYITGPIENLVPSYLIDQKSDFKSYGTMRGITTGGVGPGGTAGGGGGAHEKGVHQPSRQNLLSRSGNSLMSLNSQNFPPLSLTKDGDDNGYYTYQYDDKSGTGVAVSNPNDFTLTQSKSYAEKYFPREMDLLSPSHANTPGLHSPVRLQLGSYTRSPQSTATYTSTTTGIMSPVETSKNHKSSTSGFSSPITTNRSKTSLSSRRQKNEYDAEIDAVRRL